MPRHSRCTLTSSQNKRNNYPPASPHDFFPLQPAALNSSNHNLSESRALPGCSETPSTGSSPARAGKSIIASRPPLFNRRTKPGIELRRLVR